MRRSLSYPRCHCGHAKRSHARGYYKCTSCGCAQYARNDCPRPEARESTGAATTTGTRDVRLSFDSFHALCKYASDASAVHEVNHTLYTGHAQGTSDQHKNMGARFYGTLSPLAQVRDELLAGWPEGVSRMRKALTQLHAPIVRSVRRRSRWTDQGDEVDMTRVYSGNIETAFRACKRVSVQQPPRVKIVADIGGNSNLNKDDMFFRGAAATALAEALTAAGYAVSIIGGARTVGIAPGTNTAYAVTVKTYDAPFSLAAVCALMAHVSAYRRAGFCAWIRACGDRRASAGLGHAPFSRSAEELGVPVLPNERVFFIPQNILSAKLANEWLRETVAQLEGRAAA